VSERLRVLIIRLIAITGAPFVFVMTWLTGPPDWRGEFRRQFAYLWAAKRGRDWKEL
jgi:hypothetical protein